MTQPYGPARILDDDPDVEVKRVNPEVEIGKTGLRRVSGIIQEEFLPQLRGRKAVQVYREMADNDPIVGAELFAVDRLLRQIEWRVESASNSREDRLNKEFVEQCMEDMSHTWDDLISEIMSMVTYGWSWHEIVYKKRVGPWERDPKKRSKFDDNRVGWRKMPIRAQETLFRWGFDEDGGIKIMYQMSPPTYATTPIPIEKSLLFRTTIAKNNPEGRSLLRNAYRPWYLKKRIEEFEGIGIERDLAGLPVARIPTHYLNALPGTKEALMLAAFKKMVTSVRRDENEGLVLPSEADPDTKQPMFDFQLLTSGGSRQFDTSAIIQRYEQRILMSVLADFILIGHEGVGSYSMHTDKQGLFRTAINSIAQSIAEVFNRYAIPRLFAINGMQPKELPRIVPNDVDPPDITQLGAFMTQMAQAGITWFPDPELEKFIRDAARLPQLDPQVEEMREVQQRQANIMQLAQQRMDALNMEMQAQQGQQGLEQGQQQLENGGQTEGGSDPQTDPNAQAQGKAKADKSKIEVERAKVGLKTDKAKLNNIKAQPKKAVKKSFTEGPNPFLPYTNWKHDYDAERRGGEDA